ncbi:hypothetical protein RhiJN_08293 [Ceratobasidium sp. AG-Ba]|nr:hypothetical protein RhiJN_08293 [Ceratobasidium sp. AG-Ba]
MPSLAAELVLQILEAAYQPSSPYPHPDTSTLSSAALVCTSWAPLAQQVLFREVVLLRAPERTPPLARAAPGVLSASAAPPHALRESRPDVTPRVSRAARLKALTAAATPTAPAPRSLRSSQAFVNALEIDRVQPSARARTLAALVRSLSLVVAQPDDPSHFGSMSPLSTGALTERHLAVLFGRLSLLSCVHVVLDRVDAFSPAVTDGLRTRANVTTLGVHVLKRPYPVLSAPAFNANNAIGSSPQTPDEPEAHAAVFQLVRALAPNLDTLILDGELPRDPPVSPLTETPANPTLRPSLKGDTTTTAEPAPDCSLRALVWRGRLPPSPALLTWLLSAKAKGRAELARTRTPSRLEVLELCYLPPPDALADLLKEHVRTLRSLRLHYFDSAHVDVVRELLRPTLSELVLNKRCTATPDLLLHVQARHVAVTQPCANTVRALEQAGRRGFRRVTVVDGEQSVSEQVRAACEAEGVLFESVNALGRSLVF